MRRREHLLEAMQCSLDTSYPRVKGVARCSALDGELPSAHHQKPWLRRGPIGKKRPVDMWTIGGADRLRFPRFPSKLEKRGKCSPSPTYPPAPPTRRIDHR